MADDVQIQDTPDVQDDAGKEPHPLEPGGQRFDAVYHDMKEARRDAEAARAEAARLRAELDAKAATPAKPAQPFYTREQLEAAVTAGQITPLQAADQLAWQRKEEAKREAEILATQRARVESAKGEIQTYIDKIPALRNNASPEFSKVANAAYDIAEDMGLPVSDHRVQRRALREVFGTPERLAATRASREYDRTNADTHTETAGGGDKAPSAKDPLKAVPAHIMAHWQKRGYSREEMLKELPYVRVRQR